MSLIANPAERKTAGGVVTLEENEEVEIKPGIGPLVGVVANRIVKFNLGGGKLQVDYEEGDETFTIKSAEAGENVFAWTAVAQ